MSTATNRVSGKSHLSSCDVEPLRETMGHPLRKPIPDSSMYHIFRRDRQLRIEDRPEDQILVCCRIHHGRATSGPCMSEPGGALAKRHRKTPKLHPRYVSVKCHDRTIAVQHKPACACAGPARGRRYLVRMNPCAVSETLT